MKKNAKDHIVNAEATYAARAATTLREYGLPAVLDPTALRLGKRRADALIRIGREGYETLMAVEVKARLTEEGIAALLAAPDRDKTLLVAEHIAPEIAQRLREREVAYVDLAGNAWLRGPGHLILVEGRRPATRERQADLGRAFAIGGLRVGFALLNNPEWAQFSTRALATMAGVANGTTAAVLRDLEAQGFIVGNRAGKRRFRNRELLLQKWTEGYLQRLQPAMFVDRFNAPEGDEGWWLKAHENTLLGGEPAAARVTNFLTPDLITLYVDGNPANFLLKNRLRQAAQGKIILRRQFWNFKLPNWPYPDLTPPLLIYADLLGTNDARCMETAIRIKDQYLARTLED